MGENVLRLALISTPRSGNTWLRLILGDIYGLQHFAVHRPNDLNFDILPDRCIVQLHWPCSVEFTEELHKNKFIVVTIARHPLDVLISILQFCTHEPQTAFWLDGAGGDERRIVGKSPYDYDFIDYALGERASRLLSITCEWWSLSKSRIKYEDLIEYPERSLSQLSENIGPVVNDVDSAIKKFSFSKIKDTANNSHYWQGRAGVWKEVMPSNFARDIYRRYKVIFETLEYDLICNVLDSEAYIRNWKVLTGPRQ